MKINRPIDPRIRLKISQWPDDAPRGAVTTFCAEHQISRKTFYMFASDHCSQPQVVFLTSPLGERMEVASTGLSVEFNFALFAIVGVIAAVAVSLIPKRIAETPAVALDVEREAARD